MRCRSSRARRACSRTSRRSRSCRSDSCSRPPRRRRCGTSPEEALPWEEQLALDDDSFRAQLAYVVERSRFYRAKLAGCDPQTGLARIAELPLTEKRELKETRTAENPIGAHL